MEAVCCRQVCLAGEPAVLSEVAVVAAVDPASELSLTAPRCIVSLDDIDEVHSVDHIDEGGGFVTTGDGDNDVHPWEAAALRMSVVQGDIEADLPKKFSSSNAVSDGGRSSRDRQVTICSMHSQGSDTSSMPSVLGRPSSFSRRDSGQGTVSNILSTSVGFPQRFTIGSAFSGMRTTRRASMLLKKLQGHLGEELAMEVSSIVSFHGQEHLLRGTRLAMVLRNCGSLFASSTGDESTYSLSEHTPFLDAFLSHNWSVPRWKKFVALAFFFNAHLATVAVFVASLGMVLGSELGQSPVVFDTVANHHVGFLARLLGTPVFLIAFFFAADMWRMFFHGPIVFLDKSCIHQTDEDIMKQGIQKLGAFIAKSRQMVVLYSDVYLLKLWTVYEVASFMTLRGVNRMTVVPVQQATLFCLMVLTWYLYHLALLGLRQVTTFYQVMYLVGMFFLQGYLVALRRWARERLEIKTRLQSFSVHSCVCAVESDREVVHANIALLMKAASKVPRGAGFEEALATFDTLVREKLPQAFTSALGKYNFKYRYYVLLGWTANGWTTIDWWTGLRHDGRPLREVSCHLLWGLFWTFAIWPVTLGCTELLASYFLHWRGWRQILLVIVISFVTVVPVFILNTTGASLIRDAAMESDVVLAVLMLLTFVLGPLLAQRFCSGAFFWGDRGCRCARRQRSSAGTFKASADGRV